MSDILYRTTKATYKQGYKYAIGGLTVARNELTKVTEQRNMLAKALQMITTFDYTDLQCDNGHGPRYIATEALQSLSQPIQTKTK